ncbi:MAG: LuxR C-terminal-related transcriptional regulator [Aestuariibacter sp.]
MPKVLIADDHPLFREALVAALQPLLDDLTLVQTGTLDDTLNALQEQKDIDLVLLDLHMPGSEDFYGIIRVTEDYPDVPVAVVSGDDSIHVVSKVMAFGAKGFIPKTTPSKVTAAAVQEIMAGNNWLPEEMQQSLVKVDKEEIDIASRMAELTPKQFQVLKQLQAGLLNKQIAYDLNITEATVKAHISAIFKKLEVTNRTQAVLIAEKLQLN